MTPDRPATPAPASRRTPGRGLAAIAAWLALASPIAAPPVLAPALWVARDADTTIWLFGTVHQLRAGTPWLTGAVARAFADSDMLVLELVAPTRAETDAALVDVAPVRPPVLPPRLSARLRARAVALGYPRQAFDATDPWFAATTLAGAALARAGYVAAPAPETLLATLAARTGKPVAGLETQRAQLAMFAALPPATQRAMLARVLDVGDDVGDMDRTVAEWGRGDVAALAAMLARDPPPPALLDTRNARWASTVARWMRTPGTHFVAVGAGHLAGPGSVQARLMARGIAVTRVR